MWGSKASGGLLHTKRTGLAKSCQYQGFSVISVEAEPETQQSKSCEQHWACLNAHQSADNYQKSVYWKRDLHAKHQVKSQKPSIHVFNSNILFIKRLVMLNKALQTLENFKMSEGNLHRLIRPSYLKFLKLHKKKNIFLYFLGQEKKISSLQYIPPHLPWNTLHGWMHLNVPYKNAFLSHITHEHFNKLTECRLRCLHARQNRVGSSAKELDLHLQ